MTTKNIHTEHCCVIHGCKYNNNDCPVDLGELKQSYPCESCNAEDIIFIFGHGAGDWIERDAQFYD